jgi:hypothetical protein
LSVTLVRPRVVNLTTGGMPKISVAMMPGGLPVPKNATTGIRKTKAGMVCM